MSYDNRYGIDSYLDERGTDVEVQGITFRCRVEHDQDHSVFDDGDWYGELNQGVTRSWQRRPDRPDHFDGNAECLGVGRSYDRVWWQPPADVKRTDAGFAALRRSLLDLLEYGYVGVLVDSDVGEESLWSIGSMETEYQCEVACDLIDELLHRAGIITLDVLAWVNVGLVPA